jgi:hypothetical protein
VVQVTVATVPSVEVAAVTWVPLLPSPDPMCENRLWSCSSTP